MKRWILLPAILSLLALSACKIPFFEPKGPTITISNASAVRDEVTDLPLVTVDWTVTFPSDAYPQTADSISVGCFMTQRYVTGPRSFTGPQAWGAGSTNRKGPFYGTATIPVPEDGRHIQGAFYIKCSVYGIADETVSNELSVSIPPSCTDNGGPTLGKSVPLRNPSCIMPTTEPTVEPTYTEPTVEPTYTEPTVEPTYTEPQPTATPTTTYDYDKPFHGPQYLIHVTGHGTMDGNVVDSAYWLYPTAPDAQGNFLVPDGSGGTYGYSSDYHSGPYYTPRQVCTVVSGTVPDIQTWSEWNYSDYFDCTGVY